MMKRILIMLLICVTAAAGFAQTGTVKTETLISKYAFANERLYIPDRDTTWTPSRNGALTQRPADGIIYQYFNVAIGNDWTPIIGGGGGGAVSSVFGRTGAVSALEADYSAFYPVLSGTYNNPTWLNQLAWAKITGAPTFLTYHLINGAANVGGGVEFWKDTSGNKIRIRTATQGYGIDVTQLTDNVKYEVDTLEMATRAHVKHVKDSLLYLISGEAVAWGTYAQRVALISPVQGQRFYQTNEKQGEYIYNGGVWEFIPPENVIYHYRPGFVSSTQVAGATSGAGATASLQQARYDSVFTHYYEISTGGTTTGRGHVGIAPNGGQDFHGLPIDSNYVLVLSGDIKIATAQTATENYIFKFGIGAGSVNDFVYGLWITSEYDSASAAIRTHTRSSGNILSAYTSTIMTSDLDSQYIRLTIVANTTVVKYYVNGTLIREERTNIINNNTNTLWTLGITKRAGTTSRLISLRSVIAYITRRKI
jgi:hypothetical protein